MSYFDTGRQNEILDMYDRVFTETEGIYGLNSNNMLLGSLSPIVVTGGSGAYGTTLQIHNGNSIYDIDGNLGTSDKYFSMNKIAVTAVGTANRATILSFFAFDLYDAVACTFQNTGDTITKNSHGLQNGQSVMFVAGAGALPAELNTYTIYYVVNRATNTFQVSLTSGGSAVTLASDGNMSYQLLNASTTQAWTAFVSMTATTSNSYYLMVNSPKVACSRRIGCTAVATGGTNAISFFALISNYRI